MRLTIPRSHRRYPDDRPTGFGPCRIRVSGQQRLRALQLAASLQIPSLRYRAGQQRSQKPTSAREDLTISVKQKAKTRSFSHSLPRPPQTPAAPFKRAYRKRRLEAFASSPRIREGGASDKS